MAGGPEGSKRYDPSIMSQRESQSAAAVLMVRPVSFGFNAETAASNAFQLSPSGDVGRAARHEFDALASILARAGIEVLAAGGVAALVRAVPGRLAILGRAVAAVMPFRGEGADRLRQKQRQERKCDGEAK